MANFKTRKNGSLSVSKELLGSSYYESVYSKTSFLPVDATPTERVYCVENNIVARVTCNECNIGRVKFVSFTKGYGEYCSVQCSGRSSKRNSKRKQTNIQRYGVDVPLKNPVIAGKVKETNIQRYGVSCSAQSGSVLQKVQETNIEKYGVTQYLSSSEFRTKRKETMVSRFGTEHYTQTAEYKQRTQSSNMQRYNRLHSAQRNISDNTLGKLQDKEWLVDQHYTQQKSLSEISSQLVDISSTLVGKYFRVHGLPVRIYNYSLPEKLIREYIRNKYNTDVIANDRTVIAPKEIDILVPEFKLAIEYNGMYWHRPEVFGGIKGWLEYHVSKEVECEYKGYRLLHVWSDVHNYELLIDRAINGEIDNNYIEVLERLA